MERKRYFGKEFGFWKIRNSFGLGKKERKIEKRKMEKNWIIEDIFLVSKNENIGNTDS